MKSSEAEKDSQKCRKNNRLFLTSDPQNSESIALGVVNRPRQMRGPRETPTKIEISRKTDMNEVKNNGHVF